MGMQNGPGILQDSLEVSYKTKHTVTIWSSHLAPWYLPKRVENLYSQKHLHMDVYSGNYEYIIAKTWKQPRCPSILMDKQIVACPDNEILFRAIKKWAIKPWKMWRNLKCMLLSERSHLERLHTVWLPLYDILEKQSYGDSEKISGGQELGKGVMNRQIPEDF